MQKNTKTYPILLFCCALACQLFAQTSSDTTIHDIAETAPMPMFAPCQASRHPGWNLDSVRICSESQLMALLAQNVRYPESAREQNIQGRVIVRFVVEPNGRTSNYKTLRDIGAGCGQEAVRVLKGLDSLGLRWVPAKMGNKFVRAWYTLPVRFQLEEVLPYYMSSTGDTVYSQFEKGPSFRGGLDSLANFVINRTDYPAKHRDSCRAGIIEMALLVLPDGSAKVDNSVDFSNLGFDFQWEAIKLVGKTKGLWEPATFGGRPVASAFAIRTLFKSPAAGCAANNAAFDKGMLLSEEAITLAEEKKHGEAIAKLTEALALQPNNTEFLYYRGNALHSMGKREEGCADFNQIKAILGITWFEGIRRMLCGW